VKHAIFFLDTWKNNPEGIQPQMENTDPSEWVLELEEPKDQCTRISNSS
jgi:hypothetical protein